jgi:hypothetical protein
LDKREQKERERGMQTPLVERARRQLISERLRRKGELPSMVPASVTLASVEERAGIKSMHRREHAELVAIGSSLYAGDLRAIVAQWVVAPGEDDGIAARCSIRDISAC